MSADGITVDQSLFCRNGFTARGEVGLVSTRIGWTLEFDGADLTNPDGRALNADGLTVDQNMDCRNGFSARGEVRLVNATIGGRSTSPARA